MTYKERVFWNKRTYGNAIRIDRKVLIGFFGLVCAITPLTNWVVPLLTKIIKDDLVVRYEL